MKSGIIDQIASLWKSSTFELFDDERHRSLRETIIKRLLSLIMTDDERAKFFGLPQGTRIRENAKIISPENFKCGAHVWIGEGAMLDASGGLEVGDHTTIGCGVMVWSHSSFLTNLTMQNFPGSDLILRKKTVIGKGCYIVGPTSINPGITIGNRSMILPMTVVTKDVPESSIVAGNPGKVIGQVTDEYLQEKIRELRELKS